jgi:hypothetical protein
VSQEASRTLIAPSESSRTVKGNSAVVAIGVGQRGRDNGAQRTSADVRKEVL